MPDTDIFLFLKKILIRKTFRCLYQFLLSAKDIFEKAMKTALTGKKVNLIHTLFQI